MTGTWHPVGRLDAVPEGRPVEVDVDGDVLLLVRRGEEVVAASALCPHKFGRLAEGSLDGLRLTCPMHTATFDLRTGSPEPSQAWAGTLATYPVRVREGVVEVLA